MKPLKKFLKEPWTSYNKGQADILKHCLLEDNKFVVIKGGEFWKVFTSMNKTVIELLDKERNQAIVNHCKNYCHFLWTSQFGSEGQTGQPTEKSSLYLEAYK